MFVLGVSASVIIPICTQVITSIITKVGYSDTTKFRPPILAVIRISEVMDDLFQLFVSTFFPFH